VTITKTGRTAAIVVLGCRVERNGSPSSALERRLHWAAAAHRAGLGDVVVPSGGRAWGSHVEALVMARALESLGVPTSAIFPELSSLTTAENAVFSSRLLASLRATRALVVTCDWHAARALAGFRRATLSAEAMPVPTPTAAMPVRARRLVHEAISRRLDAWHLDRVFASREPHPFVQGAAR